MKTEIFKTVIKMAKSKKEAIQLMNDEYGAGRVQYIKPYKYASKGNSFYEFKLDCTLPF